jgi:hypothetical protein
MIQEAFRDDMIRAPLKVDGPALPGAQEWNPVSLKGRQGVVCPRIGHSLADNDGLWSGPVVEPRGIGGLASMVRRQHQVDWRGAWLADQLDDAELIEVAR